VNNGKSTWELWKDEKPNLKHLKIFGERTFFISERIRKTEKKKLDELFRPGIFVGYCKRSPEVYCLDLATNKIERAGTCKTVTEYLQKLSKEAQDALMYNPRVTNLRLTFDPQRRHNVQFLDLRSPREVTTFNKTQAAELSSSDFIRYLR
jgi:hypothetical protein